MNKIKEIIKKVLSKEVILYIVFGVLTTLVNFGSFYVLNNVLNLNENFSNLIAIILAVIVAYITNKDLVFHSEAKNAKQKWKEFFKFVLGRGFTMIIEFVGGLLLFKLPIPNMISKLLVSIIIVILNYLISKFFAFKKTEETI